MIVHLAGLSHVGESWKRPGDYLRVNFEGTLNLLSAARGRRLIFASSAEVYGAVPAAEQPLVEDRPLAPRSPYAMTKACAERMVLDRGGIVVRSFNAIGSGQAPTFALPSFAAQLAAIRRGESEPVLRVGDLSPRRDFVHVLDVVEGAPTLAFSTLGKFTRLVRFGWTPFRETGNMGWRSKSTFPEIGCAGPTSCQAVKSPLQVWP